MIHKMRLHNEPFKLIKNGTKTIELRLYDEKRSLIKKGDLIEFESRTTNEKIISQVVELHKYNNFEELYKYFDKVSMGYKETEVANPKDMEQYYTKEEQSKYGVVGIEIKLIPNIYEIYEAITNDTNIINIYKEIEKYEDNTKGWAYHNLNHIQNVTNIVEKILTELNYSEDFIIKAKIACFMHDIGCLQGKDEHALRSYEFAKNYFRENNIIFEDIELVLEAIKIHSAGFDTNNTIALSLILADKLDIKKTRVAEEGKKIEGMRQLLHIEDILIEIKDNNLTVNFMVDNKLNFQELTDYYFIKKVFKAIETFANKLNLTNKILFNNKDIKKRIKKK